MFDSSLCSKAVLLSFHTINTFLLNKRPFLHPYIFQAVESIVIASKSAMYLIHGSCLAQLSNPHFLPSVSPTLLADEHS